MPLTHSMLAPEFKPRRLIGGSSKVYDFLEKGTSTVNKPEVCQ